MSIPDFSFEFRVPSCELAKQQEQMFSLNLKLETGNLKLQRGLSLVELIMFIVIVSAAVAGVLGALSMATRGSADPMIQKQALAIAEAVLEEAQLMPFTYCDPDDAQAATALSATVGPTGCAVTVEAIGAEAGETRLSTTTPFDNVNDYDTFAMVGGITNIAGSSISGLEAYSVSPVSVTNQALGTIPASDSLLITVTVTGPGNTTVTLHGYRVRYAPNALP